MCAPFFSSCVRPFLKLNRPDMYSSVIFVPQNRHMLSAFCFVLRHSSMPVSVQRCQAVVYQSYGRIPMMAITSASTTCVSWWQGALKTLYALLVIEFEFRHKMIRRVMSIIILRVVDYCCVYTFALSRSTISQIASSMGPALGPPGSVRPQMGPMLALRTLLSGKSNLPWFVIRLPLDCINWPSMCYACNYPLNVSSWVKAELHRMHHYRICATYSLL